MRLAYITRVSVPSYAAQSVQIKHMINSFGKTLKKNFFFISPNKLNSKIFNSLNICSKNQILIFIFSFIFCKKNKINCIYTRDIFFALSYSFFKFKVVYEVHQKPNTVFNTLALKFLKKTKCRFVFISESLSSFYKNKNLIKSKTTIVEHDAADSNSYFKLRSISKINLRNKLKLPTNKIIIMHTGSLYPGRGVELFKHVLDLNDPRIIFISVGGTSKDIDIWSNVYKDYENIRFISHVDHKQVSSYQCASDILFYPFLKTCKTWDVASPLKLFEYLASSSPVMTTNIGAIKEIINDQNSFIFEPNPLSIKNTINNILERKKDVKLKVKNANDLIDNYYNWDMRAERILKIYD